MREGQFSRTAVSAAGLRAAHRFVDDAWIFADPLAAPILGPDLDSVLARQRLGQTAPWPTASDRERRPIRPFVALRSRIAEDAARLALQRGVRQAARVAASGERFVGYFETFALHTLLISRGFSQIDDAGPEQIRQRLAPGSKAGRRTGGHVPVAMYCAPLDVPEFNRASCYFRLCEFGNEARGAKLIS